MACFRDPICKLDGHPPGSRRRHAIPQIAMLTGHLPKDVNEILDAHYLNRDPRLGESAIRKLESQIATRKTPDPPN